jgi:hypothetical protein
MSICTACTQNKHLKRIIETEGGEDYCSVCRSQQSKVFSIERLANLIVPIITEFFRPEAKNYGSDDDEGYYPGELNAFYLDEVVMAILKQDVDFCDELAEAVVEAQKLREEADEPFLLDLSASYAPVSIQTGTDYFTPRWSLIVEELKHKRRFFSESVREFFDGIFADLDDITTFELDPFEFQSVVRQEARGFTVYRSRIINSEQVKAVLDNPYKEVGPPPRAKARAGRMSAEGVVALYCATEADAAIAELRPAIGQIAAVIELQFARPLRLLDFVRLERALDDGWDAFLDPNFRTARETRRFLRKLHTLISQPIVPGNEAEYLVTQTMAEYLAHVHPSKFDGIVFRSAQHTKGTNVVLFADRDAVDDVETFPVEYAVGSAAFHQIEQVKYSHKVLVRDTQLSLW